MQNLFIKSLAISFKIWFFALLINTIISSIILSGFKLAFFNFFLLGSLFGGIYTLPILFVFLFLLYILFAKRAEYYTVISWLLMTGILLSLGVFLCFAIYWGNTVGNVFILSVLAITSNIIGIISQMRSIHRSCKYQNYDFII